MPTRLANTGTGRYRSHAISAATLALTVATLTLSPATPAQECFDWEPCDHTAIAAADAADYPVIPPQAEQSPLSTPDPANQTEELARRAVYLKLLVALISNR